MTTPDIRRSMHLPRSMDVPRARRRLHPLWLLVGVIALGVAMILFGKANAIELQPPTWEIFVYVAGKDLREDRSSNRPLYADKRRTFTSFVECRDEIAFVKVQQSGLRLRCDRVEVRR